MSSKDTETSKSKNVFDPEVVVPKVQNIKKNIMDIFLKHKRLILGMLFVVCIGVILNFKVFRRSTTVSAPVEKSTVSIEKSFDFPALNNSGVKAGNNKIKFTVASAEKTNQVLVNDKSFTAKNDKMFLIINLELKNEATIAYNIFPGDLARLAYSGNDDDKFAPDLHNNMVLVSAISTKLDRVGFVIPQEIKDFKLFIGEIEGKKETVEMHFPARLL